MEKESAGLRKTIEELSPNADDPAAEIERNCSKFFALAKKFTHIEELGREILQTFVERIEVGPKELPEGVKYQSRKAPKYRQSIRIIYNNMNHVRTMRFERHNRISRGHKITVKCAFSLTV